VDIVAEEIYKDELLEALVMLNEPEDGDDDNDTGEITLDETKITNEGNGNEHSKTLMAALLKDIKKYPLLSAEKERALENDPERQTKLTLHNLQRVLYIAQQIAYKMNEKQPTLVLDFFQEGYFGLIRAAEKFDFNLGFRFSSYANQWIRQSIWQSIFRQSKTIRLTAEVYALLGKCRKAEAQLSRDLKRKPTEDELAEKTGIKVKKIRALKSIHKVVSLSDSIRSHDGEEGDLREQFIPDSSGKSPEEEVISIESPEKFWTLVEESFVGIKNGSKMFDILVRRQSKTLDEIGKEIGVTRQRVRQIEEEAIKRLQHSKRIEKFRQFK
jgi:RNA polymerase primary sigma factor